MISTHSAIHSSADDRNDGATSIAASSRNDGDLFAAPPDVHASPSEPLLGNSRSSAAASTSPLVKRSAAGAGTSAYAPIESGHVAATSTSVPMKEVHVDLYIRGRGKGGKGKGPACSFAAQLLGWHADRLDVAAIKRRHGLKALFAFSSTGARGLELVANPRNGLSLTTYTGKPGSRITLDGEPKEPFLSRSLVAAGGLLFSLGLLLLLVSHNPHFASLLATHNNAPSSPVMLFGVGVFVLIFWKKFTEWYK
ncbi:unnamed protein product [Closterium sp. NIES-54]